MTTKVCSVCGIEKDLSEFHKRTGRKSGHVSQCKKCKSNYDKEHNTNNREKILKRQKLYRDNHKEERKIYKENNKERIKIKEAERYIKNRERILEQHKKWKDNHKEQHIQQGREWYEANKERKAETQKLWIQNNIERHRANVRRHVNRRKRNLGFNPLNEKLPGSVAHHIDRVNVLYVPENLHKSIPHKQGEVSMNNINQASLNWYFEQNIATNRFTLEGDVL